ncbi:MAG: hypothetical protein ASARMPRED_006045 [Alectoria sarmentosa]|nr:MAG: hypothetical protein ASARMPRED_006045 [Alectoria sarmentosa]
MPAQKPPKVVLFDIGGVCVLSPFQAILDFERKNGIAKDWINYAIRYSAPNGYWQRLERGEIKMDADFFNGFTADLHNKNAWKGFHSKFRSEKKKLKETANPTQLGDHVSLKAETADSMPTENDRGAQCSASKPSSSGNGPINGRPSFSKLAKDTTIGDLVSMESEDIVESSAKSRINEDSAPKAKVVPPSSFSNPEPSPPPIPSIDGESLFWCMMSASRHRDPYIFPALERLSSQKHRPIIGALSNTVIYPPGHPWSRKELLPSSSNMNAADAFLISPENYFDVYIASADIGMRKPSRDIYDFAIQRLDEFDKQNGGKGINPENVVFLDDIGENLKMGRDVGMKTIRVQLGKTWRAVKELEAILGGVDLMDEKTRRTKL